MCGRYTLYANLNRILTDFAADMRPEYRHEPRYNIAPTQKVPIVREGDDGCRELVPVTWKLIPPNSPEPKTHLNTINAKAETLATSFTYRGPYKSKRCLIPADGWYEYPVVGGTKSKPIKQPYRAHRKDDQVFAFAGLWERWQGNGLTVDSCTIITCEPSEWFRQYHHREPVILRREHHEQWLDRGYYDRATLDAMLIPYPSNELEAYCVSNAALDWRNQGAELAQPLTK